MFFKLFPVSLLRCRVTTTTRDVSKVSCANARRSKTRTSPEFVYNSWEHIKSCFGAATTTWDAWQGEIKEARNHV